MKKYLFYTALALFGALPAPAQQPVAAGRGSYAAYPPPYKGKTDQHPGFNASMMLTRKIYADEADAAGSPRPIPTNDWWTDVIANRFSGALWSYPAMLKTSEEGVTVAFPTHWNENGTEVKADSRLTVGAVKFTAAEARAADWHDWDVEIILPSASGEGAITATLVHGQPFTWFEFDGLVPEITIGQPWDVVTADEEGMAVRIGEDLYGIYFPVGSGYSVADGALVFPEAAWLSVAPLPDAGDYELFKPYAASVVRATEVSWSYDEGASLLMTVWNVSAENLRDPSGQAPVMQGFLPHVYKHCAGSSLDFSTLTYLTPRGTMKMAASASGRFSYGYRFSGMLPFYAAPAEGDLDENGYDPEVMRQLIEAYADGGGFGGDTYWGGKGLTQMALNMTFAKQTGHADLYERSKARLKAALTDWLTYTPGEETRFFAYYPRWGGMLGFDVSYDSDAFNDHHFHYGYFIYAAALLCMEDKAFAASYGELLTMIAKDYANYDRDDKRFPFLRNLDPWAGHSYAGGLGDHGNDNGNGQESSSEAMQGWGGVYLLGVALGDRAMRDAGIFGWLTESRGTVEYWFDRDHIHPGREHNYDYSLYTSPYNTNLTSKGIGWWTWFSGDPLWMHSIQWMPVSPCLNYLSEDLDFVKWDYETMRGSTAYSWFEPNGTEAPLADQSVGNVVLCYMERYDPAGAAAVFDEALRRDMGIARGIDTGHISYYLIHSHLTHGDIDFSVTADCPTANAYRRPDGTVSFMVYNPGDADREVTFFRGNVRLRTVKAPGGKLTVFREASVVNGLAVGSEAGAMIPPGGESTLTAAGTDQYGASFALSEVEWSVEGAAEVAPEGVIRISENAVRGSKVTVTAVSGALEGSLEITVNDPPRGVAARITGIPRFVETGSALSLGFESTDQYGAAAEIPAEWTAETPDGDNVAIENGGFCFDRAGRYRVSATAGGLTASATVKVLPPLPNAALGAEASSSSEENAGTLTRYAVDGDRSTRWGSAHSDDQWLCVDLGSDHYISSATILWETAHAADYDIEVATEDNPGSWAAVHSERGLSGAGEVTHALDAVGRYVRLRCLRRATVYGYSVLEFEIGGIPVSTPSDGIVGIDVDCPALMLEGEAVPVTAEAVDFGGETRPVPDVVWSSQPEGEFTDSMFRPLTYGLHVITARSEALASSRRVLVEESVRLSSLDVTPGRMSLLTGDEGRFVIEGKDQFGGIYPTDASRLTAVVKNVDGAVVDTAVATFDIEGGVFRSSVRGDYVVDVGGMASVEVAVRDVAEANLAAGKPARASSAVGGNTPGNVTDLDAATRWESARADGEWVEIDLLSPFVVNTLLFDWEGAYASGYTVKSSLDGERWHSVWSTTSGKGGLERVSLPDIPARYLRVVCDRRATAWGNSIYEVEVYGRSRFEAENPGVPPVIDDVAIETGNGTLSGSATLSHPDGTVFASATLADRSGRVVGRADAAGSRIEFAFDGLFSGIYTLEIFAEDAFGNEAVEYRDVAVDYSVAGINIALGKDAVATSHENEGLRASNAVDGDYATRWGSAFDDGQSITVDLAAVYNVNNVRLFWNKPAYATRYTVECSVDGDDFRQVHSRSDWGGDTDDAVFVPVAARYVRLTGHERATQYGTSLNEIEVYATDVISGIDEAVAANGRLVDVYSLDGTLIRRSASRAGIKGTLRPGVYIIRGPESSEKLLVR